MHVASTMSPLQIVVTFEEMWKHINRERADNTSLTRAAYHAESIEELIEELTDFEKKANKGVTPQEFMKFLKGYGRNDR